MTIDEAIEGLSNLIMSFNVASYPDKVKAIQLGIEALIRERNNRINPGAYMDALLTGETKE